MQAEHTVNTFQFNTYLYSTRGQRSLLCGAYMYFQYFMHLNGFPLNLGPDTLCNTLFCCSWLQDGGYVGQGNRILILLFHHYHLNDCNSG